MRQIIQKIIYSTLCFLLTIDLSSHAKISKINEEKSKLTYALSEFGIVFKRKPLPMMGTINIENNNFKSVDLVVRFTSKNPFFRRFIDYDKYPDFSFSSSLLKPLKITEGVPFNIEGLVTFHGVTKKIKIALIKEIIDDKDAIHGNIEIKMTEFGLTPPRFLFFRVDDLIENKIEIYPEDTCQN